jgi:competence protein ComEA
MSSHRLAPSDPTGDEHRPLWDIGRTGVKALAAFAVVVALIAAVLAWRGRPAVEPLGPVAGEGTVAVPHPSPTVVVVAVSGRVRHPGLVRLPAGARVADAVDAAGGVLPGTDISTLNLARKVVDGELIVVGAAASAAPGAPGGGGRGLVNLNTATLADLETLPGVGPVLAQRILDYRDQHGGFSTVDDLRKVDGIGDSRFAELKSRVAV